MRTMILKNDAEGDSNIVIESMTTTQENQSENIVNESSVIEFTTQENQSDVMEEESFNNSSSATFPMPPENPHITRKSSRPIISDSNNDSSDSESFGGGVGPAPWAKVNNTNVMVNLKYLWRNQKSDSDDDDIYSRNSGENISLLRRKLAVMPIEEDFFDSDSTETKASAMVMERSKFGGKRLTKLGGKILLPQIIEKPSSRKSNHDSDSDEYERFWFRPTKV
jgi:hypothetical protein